MNARDDPPTDARASRRRRGILRLQACWLPEKRRLVSGQFDAIGAKVRPCRRSLSFGLHATLEAMGCRPASPRKDGELVLDVCGGRAISPSLAAARCRSSGARDRL